MKYRYGLHTFRDGEVQLDSVDKTFTRTPKGLPALYRITHSLSGTLLTPNTELTDIARQTWLRGEMLKIDAALVDGQDCGLLNANDAYSYHSLIDSETISGVQVEKPVTWGGGDVGPEYSAIRSFSFAVAATYAIPTSDGVYDHKESVTINGTGGARFVTLELDSGAPVQQQVSTATPVRGTQSGTIIGLDAYQAVPDRVLSPAYEQTWNRSVQAQSATRLGLGGLWLYPITYTFQYEAPTLAALLGGGTGIPNQPLNQSTQR